MWGEFLATLIMIIGLFCTFSVKIPGTLLIIAGAGVYGIATNFITFSPVIIISLFLISAISEIGGRMLRTTLTGNCSISRAFSINSTVCHLGGMLACTALLGSLSGFILWQFVAGKTFPHKDTIAKVLLRLLGVAVVRFICGCAMITIIYTYLYI